jgi:hypothetical protein
MVQKKDWKQNSLVASLTRNDAIRETKEVNMEPCSE